MITLPLQLHYSEDAAHAPVAWLLPGDDVAAWFAQWSQWQAEIGDWRVAVLSGLGVLTVPTAKPASVSPGCLPLQRIGKRVFLPTTSMLMPMVTAEELDSLLPAGCGWALFHPRRGLILVAEDQLLTVRDLLRAPPHEAADWGCAEAGPALNERLVCVLPVSPPTLDAIINQGRGDIGSQARPRNGLPQRPAEPGAGWLDSVARTVQNALARMALAALGGNQPPPSESSQPGARAPQGQPATAGASWFGSLFSWAAKKLNDIREDLEKLRHRELLRLMHLLESDPDQGLKFAIPFGGDNEFRGLANPGGQLGEREVNFNLNRLGGGGPADPWAIPDKYALDLARRYRELANRELQLGRHRRAAYFFGILLNDLNAAAAALEAGQHYREAAVLYQERLNSTQRAADCLERGGLLAEAIPLFQKLDRHEKVGDLYARLEQPDMATAAWQKAVLVEEAKWDYLAAAKITSDKIKSPEEALTILSRGWPDSRQGKDCLQRWFTLQGELGGNEPARERLKQLAHAPIAAIAAKAATTIVGVSRTFPDQLTCDMAADTVRLLSGAHVRTATLSERDDLLNSLAALAPGDRTLARDCQRFRQSQNPPPLSRPVPLRNRPRLVNTFRLPSLENWIVAAAQGKYWYALGAVGHRLTLVRGIWNGELQIVGCSPLSILPQSTRNVLAVDPFNRGPVWLGPMPPNQPRQAFVTSETFPDPCEIASVILPTQGNILGAAYAQSSLWKIWWSWQESAAIATLTNSDGVQLGAHRIGWEAALPESMPVAGDPGFLACGWGRDLLVIQDPSKPQALELPGPIHTLAVSAPYTRSRIAAGLEHGAALIWRQSRLADSKVVKFADDLYQPRICFTGLGAVVASSENGTQIYQTAHDRLTLSGPVLHRGARPWALVPTAQGAQFAMFLPEGDVCIYETE